MKVMGKLGMAVGAAVGYVLGTKAGRERYEQITASARQLMDKPQVKRVVDSAPGNLGARIEQVANKAADKVQQAGDRVATTGGGSGTATSTTTTTTPSTPSTPSSGSTTGTPGTPSTPSTSTSTATTPSVPSTPSTGTTDPSTTKRSTSGERSSRDRTKNS